MNDIAIKVKSLSKLHEICPLPHALCALRTPLNPVSPVIPVQESRADPYSSFSAEDHNDVQSQGQAPWLLGQAPWLLFVHLLT